VNKNLPSLQNYGIKKTFLDALDGCSGDVASACNALGIQANDIEKISNVDDIFKEAIDQIQYEHSSASVANKCSPTRVVGIRPHDLFHTINARLSELPEPVSIQYNTALQMCRFLGFYRGLGWDTKGAGELAKVSSATVNRWVSNFPEFKELMESAQRDSINEVYDSAIKRALDPTSSGDSMRSLILRGKGKLIGFDTSPGTGNTMNVTIQRTPQESDAINHAHQKAVEAAEEMIVIEST